MDTFLLIQPRNQNPLALLGTILTAHIELNIHKVLHSFKTELLLTFLTSRYGVSCYIKASIYCDTNMQLEIT